MLVLSRKVGEIIVVPDCEVTITVVRVTGKRVCLGVCAPEHVRIDRAEVAQRRMHDHPEARAPVGRGARHMARRPK